MKFTSGQTYSLPRDLVLARTADGTLTIAEKGTRFNIIVALPADTTFLAMPKEKGQAHFFRLVTEVLGAPEGDIMGHSNHFDPDMKYASSRKSGGGVARMSEEDVKAQIALLREQLKAMKKG